MIRLTEHSPIVSAMIRR